jgi:hypothetical protein
VPGECWEVSVNSDDGLEFVEIIGKVTAVGHARLNLANEVARALNPATMSERSFFSKSAMAVSASETTPSTSWMHFSMSVRPSAWTAPLRNPSTI